MIKIYSNNLGEGDWVLIMKDDDVLYEGHKPSLSDLEWIFKDLGYEVDRPDMDDAELNAVLPKE